MTSFYLGFGGRVFEALYTFQSSNEGGSLTSGGFLKYSFGVNVVTHFSKCWLPKKHPLTPTLGCISIWWLWHCNYVDGMFEIRVFTALSKLEEPERNHFWSENHFQRHQLRQAALSNLLVFRQQVLSAHKPKATQRCPLPLQELQFVCSLLSFLHLGLGWMLLLLSNFISYLNRHEPNLIAKEVLTIGEVET